MTQNNSWLLPEGIEELLPQQAENLERLRRRLLDVFHSWGYQLVVPPFIDYLNSLLTGAGHDLELQTFKLTDQLSGEMLGVRADMTPLVARIDAHTMKNQCPTRLCYVGTVLHTLGDALEKSRSPIQIGAELYGHDGIESDTEIIRLMLEMMAMTGIQDVHLDIGHVGIFRALTQEAALSEQQEATLFDILQRKARTELTTFISTLEIEALLKEKFLHLPELNGDAETIAKARVILGEKSQSINSALGEMQHIADKLSINFPALPLSFDLAELRGYHYHTGIVFAAFVPTLGKEIARGGRYNNIGKVFGRARPATGFSADLKLLSLLGAEIVNEKYNNVISAPYSDEMELTELIRSLRTQGDIVVQQLPGQDQVHETYTYTAVIEKNLQGWHIKPLEK